MFIKKNIMKKNLQFITMSILLFGIITLSCSKDKDSEITFPNMIGVASDYSNSDNWMYCPDGSEYNVDILWFYPTAYANPEGEYVCEISDEEMRTNAQNSYKMMGSVFETVGNVFVPYYRQVNGAKFANMTKEEIRNYGWRESRTDLYAALDYYFQHLNNGRPYILAGHSQGSNLLIIILEEYMKAHQDYYSRMVASYLLGCSLTKDMIATYPYLKAATCSNDLGVVVSWNTEGTGNANAGATLVVDNNAISINPLNWKTDTTYASKDINLGSYLPDGNGSYVLGDGIADARVDTIRGTVICTTVDPTKYTIAIPIFGPESYHGYDYGFYYMNIRENAKMRVNKWFEKYIK